MAQEKPGQIEVVVDEIIADVELIDESDQIPELYELVVEQWGMDPSVYAILIGHGITLSYLTILDEKALNDVFSVVKWFGHKHALRQKLQNWEQSVLYKTRYQSLSDDKVARAEEQNVSSVIPAASSRAGKHKLLPTTVSKNLFLNILERNEKGKIVTQYYDTNHHLESEHRRSLAHTVVDYYIANQLYFTLADMERFAQLIVERFPTEIAEIYFNPRDSAANKKHPSGLIYDRFHNRNKKAFANRRPSETDPWNDCKSNFLELSSDEIEKLTGSNNWLRNNTQPAEQVLTRWKEATLLRMRSILQETDVNKINVIAEWPRISDENGYLLIDADFDYIYGRSSDPNKLFDYWEQFVLLFRAYIDIHGLKDHYSLQLLHHIDGTPLAQDARDFIYCTIFHGIVKPTRTSSRKLPTILQAQIDLCYVCETEEEYLKSRKNLIRMEFNFRHVSM